MHLSDYKKPMLPWSTTYNGIPSDPMSKVINSTERENFKITRNIWEAMPAQSANRIIK